MRIVRWLPATLAMAAACLAGSCSTDASKEPGQGPREASSVNPPANGKEPDRVTVDHILLGVRTGSPRQASFRYASPEAAKTAADDILDRLKRGEEWAALKRQFSDDPPPGGPYSLSNRGVVAKGGEFSRDDMVPAFGDVGFRLQVGEMGVAPYDKTKSPFGVHIIKRVR